MANTYVAISTVTVGSGGSATIDFTSIPATYTDLQLVLSLRTSGTGSNYGSIGKITFNASSVSYVTTDLYGQGGGAGNDAFLSVVYIATGRDSNANQTTSSFSNQSLYIPNYASANNKPALLEASNGNNNTTYYTLTTLAGYWNVSSAINQITITSGDGNYVQYSTATLYGIKSS